MPLRINQDGSLPLLRDENNRTYVNPAALVDLASALNGGGRGGGFQFPVGALYLSVDSTNPSTLFGYGTWGQVGQGRFLVGQTDGQTGGQQVGSATHTHTFSQPSDHAALTHAGAAVANHSVTQAGAHSAHVFTQPTTHIVTQPAGHAAHAVTQPAGHSNHIFTQPANHSNHVVTQPNAHADVLNHVHVEQLFGGTTGATTGTFVMGSTASGGSLRSAQSTLNPTAGGVASQAHTGSAVDAHSAHASGAVDAHSAHSGAAVDAHSAHSGAAVDAHSGGAVDAHSAHSGTAVDAHGVTQANQHAAQSHSGGAVASGTTDPPGFVAYIWQRTA